MLNTSGSTSIQVGNAGWIKKVFVVIAAIVVLWLAYISFVQKPKKAATVYQPQVLGQLVVYDADSPLAIIFTYSQPAEGPSVLINVQRVDQKGNLVPVPYDPSWITRFDEAMEASRKTSPPMGAKSV